MPALILILTIDNHQFKFLTPNAPTNGIKATTALSTSESEVHSLPSTDHTSSTLARHRIQVMPGGLPERRQYLCESCALSFPSKKERRAHSKRAHPTCRRCSKKFRDGREFIQHQKAESHCYCGTCDIYFKKVKRHVRHLKKPGHPVSLTCDICGRHFPDQKLLEYHCCNCEEFFMKNRGLQAHLRQTPSHRHSPKEPEDRCSTCNYCGNKFHNDEKLHIHMGVDHGLVACPASLNCQQVFAMPMDLLRHFGEKRCPSKMSLINVHKHVASEANSTHAMSSMDPEDWIVSLFNHCPQSSHILQNRPASTSTAVEPTEPEVRIKREENTAVVEGLF